MGDVPAALRDALADRYLLREEVGRGGHSVVYLAQDLKHNREVALKAFQPDVAQVLGRERFLREIQTTAGLQHRHILPLYDSGEAAEYLFYVMPYVPDETLRRRLDRVGQLPVDRAVQIAKEVAEALHYAHERGLVHLDVKPGNILLPGGHVMLADFGISQVMDEAGRDRMTQAGISFGTAEYMSPEQAAGDGPIDRRSDIYSLAAVLYEMLCGVPPHSGSTAQVVLGKILTLRPTRPRDLREAVPEALEGAIMRGLSRLPADRFTTAEHFGQALVTLDRRQGGREVAARPVWPRVLGALALGTVALLGWAWLTRGPALDRRLPVPTVTPFVTGAEVLTEPAWSPAGNLVAYVSDEAGSQDVWVADPSGDQRVNLTADWDGRDVHPAWSPDGQRVAFVSDRDGGGVFTVAALGGTPRRVASVVFDGGTASPWIPLQWAEDGSIVFTSRDDVGTPQVFRIEAGALESECVTCALDTGGGHSGHLLPDGRWLVFRSTPGPEPDGVLYLADLEEGSVRQVERNTALPRWNATTGHLFFVSSRDGASELWALAFDPADGEVRGEAQRVTAGVSPSGLSVGPDGRMLIARTRTTSALWTLPLRPGGSDLSRATRITDASEFVDAHPQWMPDGGRVVFDSNRRGGPDIWLAEAAGGRLTRLTSSTAPESRPRPSPDGVWVAFERWHDGESAVRLVRADGSAEVTPDSAWVDRFREQCCVSWSPDGTRIALAVAGEGGGRRLAVAGIDPVTGAASEVRVLAVPGESQERPRFSPDGRWIAYEARGQGDWDLWLVGADGAGAWRVTTSSGLERQAVWAPDGRALFYLDDAQDVWRVEVDAEAASAAQPRAWLTLPARQAVGEDGMDVSVRGLLVAVEEVAGDLWLVTFEPEGEDR